MLNLIIPTYNARDTLPDALNSLIAQTKKMFITTIVQDGDGEDYTDIIEEYRRRGLKIILLQKSNGGPGSARQFGIDHTKMCDYIMFLDSDDILNPRAVEVLYREAKLNNFDVLTGNFIVEQKHSTGLFIDIFRAPVTWCHAKIYKLDYLRKNDIRFLDDLRLNEDSYFNLVAVNCTERYGKLEEYLYVWRDNENSLTRDNKESKFFFRGNTFYILGQIRGLKKIYENTGKLQPTLIGATLNNIYNAMMLQLYYKYEDYSYLNELLSLKEFEPIQDFFSKGENWIYLNSIIRATQLVDNNIIFYKERFVDWVLKYIQKGSKEENDIYR